MKQFIETGKIVSTFGIKGEVKIYPWSDSAKSVAALKRLYIKGGKEVFAANSRVHGDMVVSKLEGIDTVEAAEKLRGFVVYLNRDDVKLPKGVYFYTDLIGMDVTDADSGVVYGKLSEIFKGGSGEIYTVKRENGKEFMIPVIPETIVGTDVDKGVMKVRLLKGLIEDED